MDLQLAGKRVLVTGASRGIGLATAALLAKEGCEVVIVARDGAALDQAAEELRQIGTEVATIACDLADNAAIPELVAKVGPLDILVNNAGAIPPGTLTDVDMQRWRAGWDLKVYGYISLVKAFYDELRKTKGVVINIIGAAGETFPADYIAGAAGNSALMGFTRAQGRVSPRDGIRIVGINPGPVATERLATMMRARAIRELGDGALWEQLVKDMPFGRFATPDEIASAVAFLASPRSGYTSGTILTIDGGAT